MKKQANFIWMCLLSVFAFVGCENDGIEESSFDNKVYVNSDRTETILVKQGHTTETKNIVAALPKPIEKDLRISYGVNASKVADYNLINKTNAELLPEENYVFAQAYVEIPAGSVRSTEAKIVFVDIDRLDREKLYVLPVEITHADGCNVLEKGSTVYYVFKGAALINVVGDMEKNFCKVNWSSSTNTYLNQFTLETLVRARYFTRSGSDSDILSVMGVEGVFLIRLGDANYPGQIQLSTSAGSFPGKDATKVLPLNQWVHIAVTFDHGKVVIYVNGKIQSEGTLKLGSVNLASKGSGEDSNTSGFLLGASWNRNRWWAGEMCETRVWNTVRTQTEIASHFYYVDPATEGLIAYWKFNEGEGNVIYDHTGNGNDATAAYDMTWTAVELPAKE